MYCFDCWALDGEKHCQWCEDQMAKAKKKKAKPGIAKVGKITFLYFSGDVGEFIDALTSTLKDPKVRSQIGDALSQVGPAVAAVQAEEAARRPRSGRHVRTPGAEQ
jgi:hypothetical protein